jgi:hypothetical protein
MPFSPYRLIGKTTAEMAAITEAARAVMVDTDKNVIVVHDGVTPGGVPSVTESDMTAALAGKAASSHIHAQADVTGLVTALVGKRTSQATVIPYATVTDYNTLTAVDGQWSHNANASDTNGPTGSTTGSWMILNIVSTSGVIMQLAWRNATAVSEMWIRSYASSWYPWVQLVSTASGQAYDAARLNGQAASYYAVAVPTSKSTRTTTGTWTITGLTVGIPVWLVLSATGSAGGLFEFTVDSGASNTSGGGTVSLRNTTSSDGVAKNSNFAVLIPSATSVVLTVSTVNADSTCTAYQ